MGHQIMLVEDRERKIADKYCKKLGRTRNMGFFSPMSCMHKISAKQLLLKYPVWTLNVELNWIKRSETVQLGGSGRCLNGSRFYLV